jgi:hypothetical protein
LDDGPHKAQIDISTLSVLDALIGCPPRATLPGVPPRTRNIVLIVLAAFFLLGAVSYVLFNVGGSEPGRGKGDPVTGLSTP